jgi:Na+/H+ antiporter NhaA
MPEWRHIVGVAAVAAIGFTVSLFIATLAASIVAASVGALLLTIAGRSG